MTGGGLPRASGAAVTPHAPRPRGRRPLRGDRVYPSESNFIRVVPPGGVAAKTVYESLKKRAIFVRYFDQDRLRDKLRITIGTPREAAALVRAVQKLSR